MRKTVISRDKETMGGTPVSAGTRVPIETLFDHIEAGDRIDEFPAGFPAVTREQVVAPLEEGRGLLIRSAASGDERSCA